ncbi:MAG TPA: hypothetical protein VIK14_18055 [Ignavibacteria bacterium]
MFPPICDISVLSKIDLNNPKIELVTSITTLDRGSRGTFFDLSFFLKNDVKMDKYPKYVGTMFISAPDVKTSTLNEDLVDFFTDNYDLVVKFPKPKTLIKSVYIKSITKFTPKIVI